MIFWPCYLTLSQIFPTGARLSLCDLNKASLVDAVKECREIRNSKFPQSVGNTSYESDDQLLTDKSTGIVGAQTNVCKVDEVNNFINLSVNSFGGIDILLLCAGIGAHNIFNETKNLDVFHRCMNVNFFGYLNCTHAALPHLLKSRGVLTAITSFSGEVGLPYRTAYCASKFAVTGFLEALRAELKDLGEENIDIVLICPPTTNTNLRANSLTDEKLKKASSDDGPGISVEDCAACVLDATDRRIRKAFFPWSSTIASYMRPLVPDYIDGKIWAKSRL